MRVLVIPMAAMAETSGSFHRATMLMNSMKQAGIETALCAAKDINFKKVLGTKTFFLSTPMPLGLPEKIATKVFPFAQKMGITAHKTVKNFEEVLFLTGNIDYKYLKRSISDIRMAIQEFDPDVVYSEFNISASIAAKLENRKLFLTASIPTRYQGSKKSKYAGSVNRVLREFGIPTVSSCLQLFDYAERKFVPSCKELEPFSDEKVVYCGAFQRNVENVEDIKKDIIIVYMGNGTISQRKMVKVVTKALKNSSYQVYIAGRGLHDYTCDNIHIASYFNFNKLLPQAVVYINHGGQNSVIDGLVYGVPQIICPGKVFERKYNAESIVKNNAGIEVPYKDFSPFVLSKSIDEIVSNRQYQNNAKELGKKLLKLGGITNIVNAVNT